MADLSNWDVFKKKVTQLGFTTLELSKLSSKWGERENFVTAHKHLKLVLHADSTNLSGQQVTNEATVYGCISMKEAMALNTIVDKYGVSVSRGPCPHDRYDFSLQSNGLRLPAFFNALEEMSKKLTFLDWKGVVKCYGIDGFKRIVRKSPQWVHSFTK